MEEEEKHIGQAHFSEASSHGSAIRKSLNDNPHNVRAEELAIEFCKKQGGEVCREWSEGQMVWNFGGGEVPGTPDGMFEDAMGSLTCVQVVRVPLRPAMAAEEVAETLYQTVLAKVVKSQIWIKSTGIVPQDFVIFCWLPPVGAFEECMRPSEAMVWTEALIWNVRAGGWPFSLKVMVPDEPEALFPRCFALHNERCVKKDFWNDLSYFFDPADFEEDDELMDWDLFAEFNGETDVTPVENVTDEPILFLEERDDAEEAEEEEPPSWRGHFDSMGLDNAAKDRNVSFFPQPDNCARDRPPLQGLPWWGLFDSRGWENAAKDRNVSCFPLADNCARDRPPLQGLPWWGLATRFRADRPPARYVVSWWAELAINAEYSYSGFLEAKPISKHCKWLSRPLLTMSWLLFACAA
jgi:hypothetical protein